MHEQRVTDPESEERKPEVITYYNLQQYKGWRGLSG